MTSYNLYNLCTYNHLFYKLYYKNLKMFIEMLKNKNTEPILLSCVYLISEIYILSEFIELLWLFYNFYVIKVRDLMCL